MTNEERVRNSFLEQALYCEKLGSTFMRDLLGGLAQHLNPRTETGKRILQWRGDPAPKADALALRLAGGLHGLARSGLDAELEGFYKAPERSSEANFIPTITAAIEAHDAFLCPWLGLAPQTNEVARSSAIFAGLSVIASKFQLPLAVYEMGCSGGLNLQCAKFGYRFNKTDFGDAGSELRLEPKWTGGLPPKVEFEVVSRHGCDLNPLFVTEDEDAAKLVSYLWPDQPGRIARVEAAIDIARSNPPELSQSDASDWVESKFASGGGQSMVRVLYDTIAWNYFPISVKNRIVFHMEAVGAEATDQNPLGWLTFEFDDEDRGPFLKLRTWPGNGEEQLLASADAHVHHLNWTLHSN